MVDFVMTSKNPRPTLGPGDGQDTVPREVFVADK